MAMLMICTGGIKAKHSQVINKKAKHSLFYFLDGAYSDLFSVLHPILT